MTRPVPPPGAGRDRVDLKHEWRWIGQAVEDYCRMPNDLTWGIDLCGVPWPCVPFASGEPGPEAPPEIRDVDGPNLLEIAGDLLTPGTSGDPIPPEGDDWDGLRDRFGLISKSIGAQLPGHARMGVAYPRSMPPILRQYLPIALDAAPAMSLAGLPHDSRLIGLDAPVALTLEAIAARAVATSGRFAVASGTGASREWTAISVELGPLRSPPDRRPLLRIGIGPTSGNHDDIGLDPGAVRIVAGNEPVEGQATGSLVRMARSAIATGAARFALWRSLEFSKQLTTPDRNRRARLLPGIPILFQETAFPIGLVGHNGEGAWFWRKLWDAGTPIATPRVTLRSSTSSESRFYFAEVLDPNYRSSRWLTQGEWPLAGLRWHSTHSSYRVAIPESPVHWHLELRNFNDTGREPNPNREDAPPRWGLPTWKIQVEARAEEG